MGFFRASRIALGLILASAAADIAAAADAYTVMSHDKRFRTWTKMINDADLGGYASGKRPYTIFAPVEDSLSNIDPELMKEIEPRAAYTSADRSQMTFVVQSHVALTKLPMAGLAGKVTTLESVNGKKIVVDATKTPATVTFVGSEGTIAGKPIETDNAIIYPVLLGSAHYVTQ